MTRSEQRKPIRELLAHPHCTSEVRDSLATARRFLEGGRGLSDLWIARLVRYRDALDQAAAREAEGMTPFVDLPRERKAVKPGRPRTKEAKAAAVVAFEAPEWTRDASLLPKRPPGRA